MKAKLFNSALFVFGNLFIFAMFITDTVRGTKHPRLSEHDRFADGAIYSNNPRVDPLAATPLR